MRHLVRILSLSPMIILLSLFLTLPALALPPLPSSFYGTVKVDQAKVPDGTVIQALMGGQVYARGVTQTYQGDSVFTLDVLGDDTETAVLEGGRDGDVIQFKIGGILADQTAVWHGGMNVVLNLTATSSESKNDEANRSGNILSASVVVIALPIITVIGYTFWTLSKKRI